VALIAITGTLYDAAGTGVQNALLRLSPAPYAAESAEAIGGIGIVSDPVESVSASGGTFSVNAVQGFRYRLEIPSINFDRSFVAPAGSTIRFDLLGLRPEVESAPNGEDADGATQTFLLVKANPIDTVRERYDQIIVQRATTLAGSYTTVATVDLLPGKSFYEVADTPPDNGVFYRVQYTNAVSGDTSAVGDVVSAAREIPESLLVSVDELKELYLFGADLSRDDGTPFPRRMFEHYIQAATAWLTKELDLPLNAVDIVQEKHDHYARDYSRWGYFQLQQYPVISVSSVVFQYPSMNTEVVINNQWVVVTEGGASGVIQIVPGQGGIADVLLIPGALMPLWSGRSGRVPGIWRFNYRAGFEVGTLPADLKHALAMHASIGILNIAGDLIAGAGIATKSVSVPGLSQNIGTTSSATNSGYGARIGEYQKELKAMIPNLRRYYGKGTRMVVV
tara:strand:- start:4867 stop:6216 length:1350 start_codon:yes stop_codon:yes gene_type:complete